MAGAVQTAVVVAAWYAANIGVLLLNKFLLTNTGFRQPVFLTLCHMLACAALGYALSLFQFTPLRPLKSRKQAINVATLSSIFCVTIVLGNVSLKYIPISFTQALGSTTPFFTAIFALMLQGVAEDRWTYATLVPIAVGVVIASGGEPSFNMLGFITCILATAARALKSVVQAILMADQTDRLDPMSLLLYMSLFCIGMLLPAAWLLEPQAFARAQELMAQKPTFIWWLAFNCLLAYAVNLTNFLVTKYTSALTLQVLGNAKGVIAAVVSVFMFGNPVTARGMFGYLITVAGVVLYSETKRRHKLAKAVADKLRPQLTPDVEATQSLLGGISGGGGGGGGSNAKAGGGFQSITDLLGFDGNLSLQRTRSDLDSPPGGPPISVSVVSAGRVASPEAVSRRPSGPLYVGSGAHALTEVQSRVGTQPN